MVKPIGVAVMNANIWASVSVQTLKQVPLTFVLRLRRIATAQVEHIKSTIQIDF